MSYMTFGVKYVDWNILILSGNFNKSHNKIPKCNIWLGSSKRKLVEVLRDKNVQTLDPYAPNALS